MNCIKPIIFVISIFYVCYANASTAMQEETQASHEHLSASKPKVKNLSEESNGGVTDLKFNELYKMPVGPRGMEPSTKMMSLNKKQVRIVGYMAKEETHTSGLFIIAPLPVNMGDDDDKFADDMPANSIYVHLENPSLPVDYIPGLISLTGLLSVGNVMEVDDRVSYVRLLLDSEQSKLLTSKHQASN